MFLFTLFLSIITIINAYMAKEIHRAIIYETFVNFQKRLEIEAERDFYKDKLNEIREIVGNEK